MCGDGVVFQVDFDCGLCFEFEGFCTSDDCFLSSELSGTEDLGASKASKL